MYEARQLTFSAPTLGAGRIMIVSAVIGQSSFKVKILLVKNCIH